MCLNIRKKKWGVEETYNLLNFMFLHRENPDSGVGSWDWNLSGNNSTYHALYPRAWTVYEGKLENVAYFQVLYVILSVMNHESFSLINLSVPIQNQTHH